MLFYAQSTRTFISGRRREENKTRTDKLYNHLKIKNKSVPMFCFQKYGSFSAT